MPRTGRSIRSLSVWMAATLPALALMLGTIARPTTLSIMGTHALVVVLALIGLGSLAFIARPWRPAVAAFSVASVAVLLWVPANWAYGYRDQWDALNGPGLDEPGPFRGHQLSEVVALVFLPYVALLLGGLAALIVRVTRPTAMAVFLILAFIAFFIFLLMPTTQ